MKHFFFSLPIGMRYMVLSAFGFSLMAVFVKFASIEGIPVLEIVAARALVSLILSYADIRYKRISVFGQRKGLLFLRGFIGSLALVCVYYAITQLPLAEATVLQYLSHFHSSIGFIFSKRAYPLVPYCQYYAEFLRGVVRRSPSLFVW